jgi:hypothetical protein
VCGAACAGPSWFTNYTPARGAPCYALTHGNSASVCEQAFSLLRWVLMRRRRPSAILALTLTSNTPTSPRSGLTRTPRSGLHPGGDSVGQLYLERGSPRGPLARLLRRARRTSLCVSSGPRLRCVSQARAASRASSQAVTYAPSHRTVKARCCQGLNFRSCGKPRKTC